MSALAITSDEVTGKLQRALPFISGTVEFSRLCGVAELRTYEPPVVVQQYGAPPNGLWFVVRGLLELRRVLSNGKKSLHNLVFPGYFADPTCVLDGLAAPFDYVVSEPSVLVYVSSTAFNSLSRELPALTCGFVRHLCFSRRLSFVRMGAMAYLSPRSQIARLLVYWSRLSGSIEATPGNPPLSLTQEDIGAFWGLSRSTVNKELAQMTNEGVLEICYGGLRVLDLVRLSAIASAEEPFDFFEHALIRSPAPFVSIR